MGGPLRPRAAQLFARGPARRRPGAAPAARRRRRGGARRAARPARRPRARGRRGRRPRLLRRAPARRDGRDAARARPLRARARLPGARARPAAARHLPRHADAERGERRDDRAAPARADRHRGAPPHARQLLGPFGAHRARLAHVARGGERQAPRSCRTTTRGSPSSARASRRPAGPQDDEVVEAIELPDRRFAVGVLWHPEEDERSRVIGALVEEARGRGRS